MQHVQSVNFTKDGNYPVTAVGALTIHGITKNITAPGSVIIKGNKLTLKSVFTIKRIDFGITTDEIADELEITVIAGF
jgi:polyisoprenoid-binding protein YceI